MTAETVTRNTKCPCRKKKCERHGDFDACKAYHAGNKRPPACERHKTIVQRLAGFVGK